MDITQLIMDDHQEQRRLFAQLADIDREDTAALKAVWERLHDHLDAHAEAEERFFYPRLLAVGTGGGDAPSADEETEDAIDDHNEIHDAGEKANGLEVGSDDWFEAVWACQKANSDHLAEEERQGIADFREHASLDERHALGVKFAAFRASHRTGYDRNDKEPEAWVKEHEAG